MRARFLSAVTMGVLLLCGCGDKGTEGEKEIRKWSVSGTVVRVQTSIPVINARVILGQDSTVTDSAGKYLFAEVVEGVYPISVMCDSFGIYNDEITVMRNLIYDITLVPKFRLYGKITDRDGQAVYGARVYVGGFRAASDIDGRYGLEREFTGLFGLLCRHPDFYEFTDTVELSQIALKYDIVLDNLINLRGTVRDEEGDPLGGVGVSAAGRNGTTWADGKYQLKDVPFGFQEVVYNHAIYDRVVETLLISQIQTVNDVTMEALRVETLYIAEDAAVTFHSDDSSISLVNSGNDRNIETMHIVLWDNTHIVKRIYLKIPYPLDLNGIRTATLLIHNNWAFFDYLYGNRVSYGGTNSRWNESTICWANKPDQLYNRNTITCEFRGFYSLDVLNHYLDSTAYGSSLMFWTEVPPLIGQSATIVFASGEYHEPNAWPRVVLTFAR